jgi:hypothetical protein
MKTRKQLESTLTAATLLLAVAGAIPLAAQTSPTTPTTAATCTTAPTGLTTLNFERAATLADILETSTPNLPPNVLASIAGGAQEIREIFVYNSQQGTVTSTVFLVASGAPLPTPNFNFQTGVIESVTTRISLILTGCNPVPSLLLVGTVSSSSASGAFGNVNGSPVAISIGYTTDTPAKINNVAEVLAGLVVAYSPAGTGTVTFPAVTVVPPGSTGAVTITVSNPQLGTLVGGAKVIQTGQNPTLLDASASMGGSGGDALTYSWSTLGAPVNFNGTGKTGQIEVTFPSPGDFTIQLTVTDTSTGTSAMYSVILEYAK